MDFISFILSIRASEGNTPDSCVGSREITLTQAKPSLTIGRDPDKDVVLINNHVSRKHAEIRWDGRKLLLFDRHSRAWTFVGGNKLDPDQPYEVKPGDSFRIEPYVLTVTFGRVTGDIAGSVAASSDDQSTSAETDMTAIPIHPVIAPECTSSSYLRYLPDIFHESDFLGRYLRIFESIWEPLEQRQAHIHCYFDPRTCPSALLPWLAEWFGWPLNQHWPESIQRCVVSRAMELHRWRGTAYGLIELIQECTGVTISLHISTSNPNVICVSVPLAKEKNPQLALVEFLLQQHKPAHLGYEITRVDPEKTT